MARVNINPEILLWAAQRGGVIDRIAEKFPKWDKWITGKEQPTLKQLEKIANFTRTPLGYFFLQKPFEEKLPIPHYRTNKNNLSSNPSPELLDTIYAMKRRQDWMREYLIEKGQDKLPFVGSKDIEKDNPILVAQEIRNTLGLDYGWANNCNSWEKALETLFQKVENIGILLVINGIVGNNTHRKLDVNEFRGFVLIDEYAPLIFINGADAKAAQMFTLAHELAHIWYGKSAVFDLQDLLPANDKNEEICNKVAAEFLVPEEEMNIIWAETPNNLDKYQQLARYFKVSEIVIARRALDLGKISKEKFFHFYNNRSIVEHKQTTGGDFYNSQKKRIGKRFAEAVFNALMEDKLPYTEAYRLTGLTGATFFNFVERLKVGDLL